MWDGFDNRKFPRIRLQCEIQIDSPNTDCPIKSQTENVGGGGVSVILKKPLERFAECKLNLIIDKAKKKAIKCVGKIMWVVSMKKPKETGIQYDIGIEFIEISVEDRECLKKIVENCTSQKKYSR